MSTRITSSQFKIYFWSNTCLAVTFPDSTEKSTLFTKANEKKEINFLYHRSFFTSVGYYAVYTLYFYLKESTETLIMNFNNFKILILTIPYKILSVTISPYEALLRSYTLLFSKYNKYSKRK